MRKPQLVDYLLLTLLSLIWASAFFNIKIATYSFGPITIGFLRSFLGAIPVLILIVIAVPSFKLLYKQDVIPEPDLTIKAIGYQWYWGYEYPDNGNFSYEAFMVQSKDELEEDKPFKRMLTTDTKVVVPVNKIIRMQITAADVLHSWAVPAFGVKKDAVPGRLNETWFKPEKTGIFYGMCSELCGVNHQSMPIEIHVVTEQEFNDWVEESKLKYAAKNNLIANKK